jgi:Ca2+-transporting ATPase
VIGLSLKLMAPATNKPAYSLTTKELFDNFGSSENGLTNHEAETRIEKYGLNKLSEKKKISPFEIYANQFKSILILILIAASILTFAVYFLGEKQRSDLIEGGLILSIVFMITILGFIQEFRAEKAIEALKKLLAYKAKVVRDGKEIQIDTLQLVPGDLVVLEEGEKVPADIRLTAVSVLNSNEAPLTGESNPVTKGVDLLDGALPVADQKNMVFSGTVITSGRGKGIVISTGDSTEIGKIADLVAETKEEETPIQKRLDNLGKTLGIITIVASGFVFLFIVFFAQEYAHLGTIQRVLQSFIAAVALAVAAIPEGLPAVVTISLAFGTQRMVKRNALVRKLASMETLGSVDVICADKTGTLTTGQMTVREIFFDGKLYKISGRGYETKGEFTLEEKRVDPKTLSLILKAGLSCNNSLLNEDGKILGDPTEGALVVSAHKASVKQVGKRLCEIPFSAERKMMSVAVKEDLPTGEKTIVYAKGAPEIILEKCSKLIRNGQETPLNPQEKSKILDENLKMAGKALRILGIAYKETNNADEKTLEEDLTFIGMQAMMDPPRKEVKDLIRTTQSSGIRVIMITGDHLATAKAIASEINITGDAVVGTNLDKMSEGELEKKAKNTNIYARVNPEHKLKIIEGLKKHGHLVAMTGDGVNDAPALKRADIGVAMGITGTDVAKESSDMILLDDHFKTIVAAIEEGRGIFDNIRKFVNYLLSSNVGEVLAVFLGLLLFQDIILTAVMLLWINVVTDGLPAIALGLDPAEKGILNFSPKKFQGQIINPRVWVEIAIFSIFLTIATLVIFSLNISEGVNEARAAAFMAIIIYELVRLVNIRSAYKISWASNTWLLLAIVSSVLLQMAIVYVPLFSSWFEISPIDSFDWIYIAVTSVVMFLILNLSGKVISSFPLFQAKQAS